MPYSNTSSICEICGKAIDSENLGSDFNEVEITHTFGQRWEGDYSLEGFRPCICGECFKNKIYPFLKSLGVKSEYLDL